MSTISYGRRPMYANSKFDRYLTSRLKSTGKRYADFARESGVGTTALQSLRKGNSCSFDTAHAVAVTLGITMEELYQLVY